MNTITKHYIDGALIETHGREVVDIVNPTRGKAIARMTLADEEDARRGIAAAKRAFASFGRTTKEERASMLRLLHEVFSVRVDDLTAAMVGGVRRCGSVRRAHCAGRRRSADSSIPASVVNSERSGSRRFLNRGPSSNDRLSRRLDESN
jgi:hypothetical protein